MPIEGATRQTEKYFGPENATALVAKSIELFQVNEWKWAALLTICIEGRDGYRLCPDGGEDDR
jgi:hypothetical protein